jgi:hypothetical protein
VTVAPPSPPGDRALPFSTPLSPRAALAFGLVAPALLLLAGMARVRSFTVDDAYISYRYARNLARGLGLVYNAGERVEGYTNFLWTVLLAGAIRLGLDPDVVAKALGALSALASLGLVYLLAARLRPFSNLPCVATWLLASSAVFGGHAVFGLETALFTALVLAGAELFFREEAAAPSTSAAPFDTAPGATPGPAPRLAARLPLSGAVFALAALTRPEAPLYVGVLMLSLGRGLLARKNLLRGALFAAPVLAHLLWRRAYYGAWLPNTLAAKLGPLDFRLQLGGDYLLGYAAHAGPALALALVAVALGVSRRHRDLLAVAAVTAAVGAYVALIGGDWMPLFRFMAPLEPFAFLLADAAARDLFARPSRALRLALLLAVTGVLYQRASTLRRSQRMILDQEAPLWAALTGGTARWLEDRGAPGEIALGDIGYVGYATDYPVLDLLGLVDPTIAALPGSYTRKVGPGLVDHLIARAPAYVVLISSRPDCQRPANPGSLSIYRDLRFKQRYRVAGTVQIAAGTWCIHERTP